MLALRLGGLLHHVICQVALDDRRHQPVHRAANGGNLLEDGRAIPLFGELFFKRGGLSLNTPDARLQLGFVANGMGHGSDIEVM
ncbi:Uncharacterised protein [Klebsiella pneumoniae]|nr:Uncharacterised protein [Klebsiella pneumoniae]